MLTVFSSRLRCVEVLLFKDLLCSPGRSLRVLINLLDLRTVSFHLKGGPFRLDDMKIQGFSKYVPWHDKKEFYHTPRLHSYYSRFTSKLVVTSPLESCTFKTQSEVVDSGR